MFDHLMIPLWHKIPEIIQAPGMLNFLNLLISGGNLKHTVIKCHQLSIFLNCFSGNGFNKKTIILYISRKAHRKKRKEREKEGKNAVVQLHLLSEIHILYFILVLANVGIELDRLNWVPSIHIFIVTLLNGGLGCPFSCCGREPQ